MLIDELQHSQLCKMYFIRTLSIGVTIDVNQGGT